MDFGSGASDIDTEQALFALGAVLTGAITVLVLARSDDVVQGLLFGAFSVYLLGGALPAIHDRVPQYQRTGAIALGGVGGLAYAVGTQSALPLLFVLGGVAALLRLF